MILIKLSNLCTLPIVLFLFKTTFRRLDYAFVLRGRKKPTQLDQIDRVTPYYRTSEPTHGRIYKRIITQTVRGNAVLNKNRTKDNVQEVNNCINITSSRTFRSYSDNEIRKHILAASILRSSYAPCWSEI
jgi:hypothetical protein